MKDKIKNCIEKNLDQLFDIAKILYENPEISEEEKISSEILRDDPSFIILLIE